MNGFKQLALQAILLGHLCKLRYLGKQLSMLNYEQASWSDLALIAAGLRPDPRQRVALARVIPTGIRSWAGEVTGMLVMLMTCILTEYPA
jgi:hypothetical protein